MNLAKSALFSIAVLIHAQSSAEQQVIIWDYDGTIVKQHVNTLKTNTNILPNIETAMQGEATINIICSGIRSLEACRHTPKKKILYNPEQDIEKFKNLMNQLPIKAAVFSYTLGGTECWVLIKTDTGFEVRTAHTDTRYLHLNGYFQKPDTGMLQVIKDLLSEWQITIEKDALLFIGDTLQDQQAAEAFGISFKHAHDVHAGNGPRQTPLA